ncbi:MAG: hypothetical protein V3S57_05540, partial [candidate division NC10 bacterium]
MKWVYEQKRKIANSKPDPDFTAGNWTRGFRSIGSPREGKHDYHMEGKKSNRQLGTHTGDAEVKWVYEQKRKIANSKPEPSFAVSAFG